MRVLFVFLSILPVAAHRAAAQKRLKTRTLKVWPRKNVRK